MAKYKVGDKVRIVGPNNITKHWHYRCRELAGLIVTIKEVVNEKYFIGDNDSPFFDRDFVGLAEEPNYKFKYGDKVMYEGKEWEVIGYKKQIGDIYLIYGHGSHSGELGKLVRGKKRDDGKSRYACEDELQLVEKEELSEGDMVYVWDDNISKKKKVFMFRDKNGNYWANDGEKHDFAYKWRYAIKAHTKKERIIYVTDEEYEFIKTKYDINE